MMSNPLPLEPQQAPLNKPLNRPSNPNAMVGIGFAAVGLVGWLLTLAFIFSFQREQLTGDGQRDLVIGLGNFLDYIVQVVVGIVGLVVFGFFSATGLIVSLIGLQYEPRQPARIGVGLGAAGALVGISVVFWRLIAWGLFS